MFVRLKGSNIEGNACRASDLISVDAKHCSG